MHFAISCMFALIGLLGNLALFGFCLRRVRYYNMTNVEFFMSSLACSNFIKIGVFVTVAYAAYYASSWTSGFASCRVVSKVGAVTYLMSEFTLIFLTYVNYKLVATDNFYIDVRRKFIYYAFTAAFVVVCGVIAIPGVYDWKVTSLRVSTTKCPDESDLSCIVNICEIDLSSSYSVYILIAIFIVIFLPTIYFIAAFTRVRQTLNLSLEKIRSSINVMYYRLRLKENFRLLSILAVTCFGFTIAYVPVMFLHLYYYMKGPLSAEDKLDELYSWYTFLMFTLTMVDTCSTPIAYLVVHPSFRRMMYKTLCFCCRIRVLKRRKTVLLKRDSVFTVESFLSPTRR